MDDIDLAITTTDIYLLEKLSDNNHWPIRMNVAKNPNTPDYILENLSDDHILYVKCALVKNPNTPAHILDK